MRHGSPQRGMLLGASLIVGCSSAPPVPGPPAPVAAPASAPSAPSATAVGEASSVSAGSPEAAASPPCAPPCTDAACLPSPAKLSLGNEHGCALLSGGEVACWGDNHLGQIDDGAAPAYPTPRALALPAGFRPVSVAAGDAITCALAADGRVHCRGLDDRRPPDPDPAAMSRACAKQQLDESLCRMVESTRRLREHLARLGGTSQAPVATALTRTHLNQPITDAALLSTGPGGMCVASRVGGKVRCYPMVAPGAFPSMATPGEPVAIANTAGAVQLDGGVSRGCVRKGDGSVACWSFGDATPVEGVDDAIDLAVDLVDDPCVLRGDGRVQCFRVAIPPDKTVLRDVDGLPPMTAIDAGRRLTCGLDRDGAVWCWGELADDWHIQRGAGPSLAKPTRIEHVSGATALSVGGAFACVVMDGRTRCFGSREHGRIGDGTAAEAFRPVAVALDGRATHVAADDARTCAVLADGSVRCWGYLFGPTQTPFGTGRALAPIEGIADATAVVLSGNDACAVTRSGGITCWGFPHAEDRRAMKGITDAVAFDPGPGYRCAVHATGRLSCFVSSHQAPLPLPSLAGVAQVVSSSSDGFVFRRRSGSVGFATLYPQLIASDPLPAPKVFPVTTLRDAVDVDATAFRACAVSKGGAVQCQSLTAFGSMGGQGKKPRPPTKLPDITNAVEISLADASTLTASLCARLADGRVACQGDPRRGVLGDGKGEPLGLLPGYAFVAGIDDAAGIAVGANHACARHRDGRVSCWGDDAFGQASGTARGYEPCPTPVRPVR